MADDVKAATVTAAKRLLDEQEVEQGVSWLGARLREPSTYAGLGAIAGAAAFFHLIPNGNSTDVVKYVTTIGMALGGLIAVLLPESKSGGKKPNPLGMGVVIFAAALAASAPQPARAQSATVTGVNAALSAQAQQLLGVLNQIGSFVGQFASGDLNAAIADANAQTPANATAAACWQTIAKIAPAQIPQGAALAYLKQRVLDLQGLYTPMHSYCPGVAPAFLKLYDQALMLETQLNL